MVGEASTNQLLMRAKWQLHVLVCILVWLSSSSSIMLANMHSAIDQHQIDAKDKSHTTYKMRLDILFILWEVYINIENDDVSCHLHTCLKRNTIYNILLMRVAYALLYLYSSLTDRLDNQPVTGVRKLDLDGNIYWGCHRREGIKEWINSRLFYQITRQKEKRLITKLV